MLVQGSSILELVKIATSTFDSHALQEVGPFYNWVTAVTRMIARASIWPRPFIEHIDTTRARVYLDIAFSI